MENFFVKHFPAHAAGAWAILTGMAYEDLDAESLALLAGITESTPPSPDDGLDEASRALLESITASAPPPPVRPLDPAFVAANASRYVEDACLQSAKSIVCAARKFGSDLRASDYGVSIPYENGLPEKLRLVMYECLTYVREVLRCQKFIADDGATCNVCGRADRYHMPCPAFVDPFDKHHECATCGLSRSDHAAFAKVEHIAAFVKKPSERKRVKSLLCGP